MIKTSAWTWLALCAACTSETQQTRAAASDGGVREPTMDAAFASECEDAARRACTCSNGGTGQKTCTADGTWSACTRCSAEDAGRGVVQQLCRAGYYVGHMEGSYKPGFASWGIAENPFAEVQFVSMASGDAPPLALTLTEHIQGAGEVSIYSVSGGCMLGLARSQGTNNPFAARLTGQLDCRTGDFDGVMKGRYTLLDLPGLDYSFEGPFTAHFVGDELADGQWSAEEPAALNGQPAGGGSGTWGATWKADDAPSNAADPCAGLDPDAG